MSTLERKLFLQVYEAGKMVERRTWIPICGDPDHRHGGTCKFWSFGRRVAHFKTVWKWPR